MLWVSGIVLAACAHQGVRAGVAEDAHALDEGVRPKGGSSAAWRINVLIGNGQYAEARALLEESIAAGLLTRAEGEGLREKLGQADSRKDKGEDTEPKRPPPLVRDRATCSSQFPSIKMCAALPEEYSFHSEQQALNAMKARLGKKNLSLHDVAIATEGPCADIGTHFNVRLNGKREGSIACCPCCVNTAEGPIEWTKCRIVW